MEDQKIVVGITQGDINGIGYEVIIKALLDPRILEICTPVVYGSPKVLAYHRKALNIPNFSLNTIATAKEANNRRANLINCLDDNVRVELGKSSGYAGEAAFITLEMAVRDLMEHQIDLLVTAPINKHNIQSKDFSFAGHTEYLQEKLGVPEVLMLMVSDYLKVGVVTGHIPLNQVSAELTSDLILRKLRLLDHSLRNDFDIQAPRIALLGLNPHSGDQGLIGQEEEEVIKPALEKARQDNIMALGPYAADGYFGSGLYQKFDAVLAMYHDQGLAPFKALSFDTGVNFTAGLPVVRTSPAHGTAYEIAGLDQASPDSMRQAIYLAVDIYKTRKANRDLRRNAMGVQ
ncbi:MAG: 4-hydroxythreonine-4-phosphate dehydrogenase PdxA [Bacteroidota bacterium]